jgi:hypothetical protein
MLTRVDGPALDRPWRRPGAIRYALARVRDAVAPPVTVRDAPTDIVADRDTAVPTRDGTILRVNVFRPDLDGKHPVILCAHPYRKDDLPRRRGRRWTYPPQYRLLRQPAPVAFSALTNWEAPDPTWWVAHGFVVINADLRGSGHSDGVGKLLSCEESQDVYDVVQWAGEQPWSDGSVVMLGVSYLAVSQYGAAALRPPALKAICPWEGFTDIYRDFAFPGGIRENGFIRAWATVLSRRSRLAYNLHRMQDSHPLRDEFWRSLVPDVAAIEVPMLVCGSFSDQALHSRGSMRAFTHTGSTRARLYTHRGGKWNAFYSDEALAEQLSFFQSVLRGDDAPARSVRLEVREDRDTVAAVREEHEWPLARTRWTPLYLAGAGRLVAQPPTQPGSIEFNTRSRAAAFSWTFTQDTELTGPMATRLWVEAVGCDDLNLFVGVEKWRGGRFVPFEGSYGYGRDRVATGWQRVSLRALDADASQPWEPVSDAVDPQRLRAGEVVAVDVALGHTATLWRAGEQLRLVVAGRWLSPRNPFTGQFPAAYPHPPRGRAILHWGSDRLPDSPPHLLVPEISA